MIERLETIDRSIFFAINSHHNAFTDKVMWTISNDFFIYPFIALFLIWFFRKANGKRTATILLGVGLCVATADLSTNMVKHNVKRFRPSHNLEIKEQVHTVNNYTGGKYGFFSSHAANTFAITVLVFLSAAEVLSRKLRLFFFVLPALIGYSRIYLGVHYPSDIFVGALNGLICGWLIHKVLTLYFFEKKTEKA